MEKEFVIYEQAVKLKELGFDGKCIGFFYTDDSENFKKNKFDYRKKFVIDFSDEDDYMVNSDKTHYVSAPLKQQVLRWFRDEHQIFASIETDCTSYPKFAIVINGFVGNPRDLTEKYWGWNRRFNSDLYRSYEEAESDCIDKLISFIEAESILNLYHKK